ncbi:cysteine-rich repeat secretory protein 15 [Tanacetum coccineum]
MFKFYKFSSDLFLFFTFFSYLVNSNVIYYGCSQEKFKPNTPFETNLNSLLPLFVSSSSQALYNSFAIGNNTSASLESAIYGLYQCRGDVSTPACTKCVEDAVSQVGVVCPYSYSCSVQYDECLVRFENSDFFGKLDTSLRFKKCSKSVSHDAQSLKHRDDVLIGLGEVDQGFRGLSHVEMHSGYRGRRCFLSSMLHAILGIWYFGFSFKVLAFDSHLQDICDDNKWEKTIAIIVALWEVMLRCCCFYRSILPMPEIITLIEIRKRMTSSQVSLKENL